MGRFLDPDKHAIANLSRADWLVMLGVVIAAIQIPAIFLVQMPRISVSTAVVPFAVIEGLALWKLFNWIERRLPRSRKPTAGAGNASHTHDADLRDAIARGEQAVDNGHVVSHAEAQTRMARWLKQGDGA